VALEAIRVHGALEGGRRRRRQSPKDEEKEKRFNAALSEKLGEEHPAEESAKTKPGKEAPPEPEPASEEKDASQRLDIVA